jgi:Flp pilus assembly protein TadD
MRRQPAFLAVLGLLLLGCLFARQALAQEDLPKLVKKIQPAVVTVIAYDAKGKAKSQGSGFFINQQGHFITNYHVLEGASRVEVKTFQGNRHRVKEVLQEDRGSDLTIAVIFPGFRPPPGPPDPSGWEPVGESVPIEEKPNQEISGIASLNLSSALPEIGERVAVVGSPMGLEQTLSEGVVSAIRQTEEFGKVLQISAPISHGSSGSPVVNMKGEVVGIATFLFKEGQNLNFAIPGNRALALKPGTEQPQNNLGHWGPPLSEGEIRSLEAKSLIQQGEDLYAKGEYERAISSLQQAISLNPEDSWAHYDLGTIYSELRRYHEAVVSLKQAIKLEPDLSMAHVTLGVSYSGMGRYREAEAAYKQAIRLDPDNAQAHLNLGVDYACQGRLRESIREYQQAIKLKPDYALAHYNLGSAYLNIGNSRASLEEYKILKELDSKKADDLFNQIYR